MMSLEELRKIEPKLAEKSDEEVAQVREQIYSIAQLAYDSYQEQKKDKS